MSGEKSATLRNGNPRRDLATLPCCGARTRQGLACRQPAMRNGRCRFHGGKSTGARTEEGKAAQVKASTTHGMYGDAGRRLQDLTRMLRLAAHLANHGIHPRPKDGTFGAWITRQMAADPDRIEDPPPEEPPPVRPPPRPLLHAVSPPRCTWRATPRRRWTEPSCLRHRWTPVTLSGVPPPSG